MSKIVLYIAASLDGMIARPDGNLDWLNAIPMSEEDDYGYGDFLANIEAIIMGRTTYEEIMGFGVDWPYPGLATYVFTHQPDFRATSPDTYVVSENFPEFIRQLQYKAQKDIWLVGGGQLVTYFLNENLLDKMILTIVPIILGKGIPLFPDHPLETSWQLAKVEQFDTGLVSLTYDKK
ncbi:MAG: dihydrofolate reductase family protein [Microscillaceae bacterium]|jgi:dihydrofolate reductase|nr:dihydrofolate reductase family protein [Microscillaceae bacterium]